MARIHVAPPVTHDVTGRHIQPISRRRLFQQPRRRLPATAGVRIYVVAHKNIIHRQLRLKFCVYRFDHLTRLNSIANVGLVRYDQEQKACGF